MRVQVCFRQSYDVSAAFEFTATRGHTHGRGGDLLINNFTKALKILRFFSFAWPKVIINIIRGAANLTNGGTIYRITRRTILSGVLHALPGLEIYTLGFKSIISRHFIRALYWGRELGYGRRESSPVSVEKIKIYALRHGELSLFRMPVFPRQSPRKIYHQPYILRTLKSNKKTMVFDESEMNRR